jgi:hypothetical protein
MQVGTKGYPATASPSRPLASDRANPFPSTANLAASSLTLARSNITVLLNYRSDSLPDALPFRQRVNSSKNVISQVWQKQPRVINTLFAKLLLVGESS